MESSFRRQGNRFQSLNGKSRNSDKLKFIKNCPVFTLLVITGLLFTVIGIWGRKSIYAGQEYDPASAPILSVMFTGLNEDIYPWQIFVGESIPVTAGGQPPAEGAIDVLKEAGKTDAKNEKNRQIDEEETDKTPAEEKTSDIEASEENEAKVSEKPDFHFTEAAAQRLEEEAEGKDDITQGRLEPLRESTREEYLNHISADIYGDAGVIRAASFAFDMVDESYFDDAIFIGDSRTVGLRDYTDLSEHADFYCETSLTIYKTMEEEFEGVGTIEEALREKDYGKIYLMVGINELGRGTTEDFMGKYTEVVDWLHELEPKAKIFIQGNMRVTGKKSESDDIFNNNNINARNNAIATLADNKQIFYIDVNEAVCDEEGNLNSEYTHDQIHLLGAYDGLWKQFLLAHGVKDD